MCISLFEIAKSKSASALYCVLEVARVREDINGVHFNISEILLEFHKHAPVFPSTNALKVTQSTSGQYKARSNAAYQLPRVAGVFGKGA